MRLSFFSARNVQQGVLPFNLILFVVVVTCLVAGIIVLLSRARKVTTASHATAGESRTVSGEGKGVKKAPPLSPEERARREEMLRRTHRPLPPTPLAPTSDSPPRSVPPTKVQLPE